MIKRISVLIIVIHFGITGLCQTKYTDSLKAVLTNTKNATERFNLLNAIVLDLTMLQIAQELNNDSLKAISYNWLGSFFYLKKGDNTSALEYYFKALPLAEKTKEKRRISSLYFDMALVYFDMLDNEMALEMTRNYTISCYCNTKLTWFNIFCWQKMQILHLNMPGNLTKHWAALMKVSLTFIWTI